MSEPRIFATSIIDGAGFTTCGCMLGDNTIIVGTDVAGLARSTDFGLAWTMQNGGLSTNTQHVVADVAASKVSATRGYAALGRQGGGGGFARTTDSGLNWTIISTVPQFSGGNNVAPLPVPHPRSVGQLILVDDSDAHIYALTFEDGVMRSDDGGFTWTVVGLAGHFLRGGAFIQGTANALYVLSYGDASLTNPGLYRILNAHSSPTVTYMNTTLTGVDPITPESIYVSPGSGLTYVADGANGIKKLTGSAWTTVLADDATWYVLAGYYDGANDVILAGAYDAVKTGTQFAVLKKSVNNGVTWTDLTLDGTKIHNTLGDATGEEWWLPADTPGAKLGQNTSVVSGIVWDDGNRNNFILTGRAGCYRTVNGTDFYPAMRGLNLTINRHLAVDNTRPGRALVCNTDYVALVIDGTEVDQVKPSPNTGFFVDVDPIDGYYLLGDGERSLNTLGKVWEAADPLAGPWVNLGAEGAGGSLSDTFDRTVASGWGTADSGSAWTGSSANYAVSPAGGGSVAITAGGTTQDLVQTTLAFADPVGVFTVDWTTDAVGNYHAAIIQVRRATNTHYDIRLRQLSTNGRIYVSILKSVAGVQTLLSTEYQVATSYVAGDRYNVRFEVTGTSPTTLHARAWRDGQTEPTIWHVDTTDSEATLQTTGQIVARTQGATSYTANATFHWRTIDLADLTSTAGSGGARPFGGKRIRNGSNTVVRVVAFEGFGIRYKVGAGAWVDGDTSLISSSATKSVPFAWAATSKILFMYWRDVGVYRSTDYGVTWTLIWSHPSVGDGFGYIAVEPTGDTLLVSASDGLWFLTNADTGTVGSGITATTVSSAVNPGPCCYGYDGAFYYCEVGASAAVYQWDGATWTDVSDEAYRQVASLPFSIDVDSDSKVYVALNGNGVVVGSLAAEYAEGYHGGYGPSVVVTPPTEPPPLVPFNPRPELRVLIDVINDVNPAVTVAAPPVWTDFTPFLRVPGFQCRRGRQRPLDRNEAGTAIVKLDNRDRIADKDADTWQGIEPMRHLNVSAKLDHFSEPFLMGSSKVGGTDVLAGGDTFDYADIFDGWIESIDYGYTDNRDATATLRCVDILGVGARSDVALALVGLESSDALDYTLNFKPYTGRVVAAGEMGGSGLRDISTDNNRVMDGSFTATTIREICDQIAESDGGNFFIARTGRPTYRDSGWSLRPATDSITLSPQDEQYHGVSMALDESVVVTDVALTGSDSVVIVLNDVVARQRYERPTYEKALLISGTDVLERAEGILLRFGKARKYIDRLDIGTPGTDWRTIIQAELWDVVDVVVPFPDDTSLTQRSVIEGIEIVTPHKNEWHVNWWLSIPPFPELLPAAAQSFEEIVAGVTVGTEGGWSDELNCTIFATSTQFRHSLHFVGPRHDRVQTDDIIVIDTVYAADGSYVLQADALANGTVSVVSPLVTVEGRGDYQATAYLRTVRYNASDELSTDTTRMMHLEIDWYAGTTLLSTTVGVEVVVPSPVGNEAGGPVFAHPTASNYGPWARAKVIGVAPNGATAAKLRVKSLGSFKAGLYVDAVSFARGG